MPSRIEEAGHTKAFDYPVTEHWAKAEIFSPAGDEPLKLFGGPKNERIYVLI